MTVISSSDFADPATPSRRSDDVNRDHVDALQIVSVLLVGQLRATCDPGIRQRLRSVLFDLHVGVAHRIARSYAGRGSEFEDVDQVAQLALVTAIDAFDPGQSSSFTAYAARTIRGALRHHFRDATWLVRPPRAVQELRLAVLAITPRLVQRLRREPTAAELAAELHVTPADIEAARLAQANRTPARLESLALLEGHDDTDAAEWRIALHELVAALPLPDQRILHARFVRELSQQAIAVELGVSQMHVSRRLRWMLDSLRSSLGLQQRAAG